MPTTYTHDKFGAEVLKQMPEKERRLIERHRNLFNIGLHGPDIFFYYRPFIKNKVVQYASNMHQEAASTFFLPALSSIQKSKSEAALVYLLGFACHYILDSNCHPYIVQAERLPGCSHTGIESELDRVFMKEDGKDPFSYLPADHLDAKDPEISEIVEFFPGLNESLIRKSIAGLRMYTNILVCSTNTKERALLGAMKAVGAYDSMEGHVIREYPVEACADCVPKIVPLYANALSEAADVLLNVCACAKGKEELSGRFEYNFE